MALYTLDLLSAALRALTWFTLLFVLAPRLIFPHGERALADDLLRMTAATIIAVHVLGIAGLYDVFSLTFAFVAVGVGTRAWHLRRWPLAEARAAWEQWIVRLLSLVEFLDAGRAQLRRWRSEIGTRYKAHLPSMAEAAWAIVWLWTFGAAAYLALYEPLANAAPDAPYTLQLSALKRLDANTLYDDGLYPLGAQALISALNRYALIERAILMRAMDGLATLFVMLCVYAVARRFTQNRGAPLIAAALYGLMPYAGFFTLPSASRPDRLSLQFALGLLLLTMATFIRPRGEGPWPAASRFGLGTAAALLTHPVIGSLAVIIGLAGWLGAIFVRRTHLSHSWQMLVGVGGGVLMASVFYLLATTSGQPMRPELFIAMANADTLLLVLGPLMCVASGCLYDLVMAAVGKLRENLLPTTLWASSNSNMFGLASVVMTLGLTLFATPRFIITAPPKSDHNSKVWVYYTLNARYRTQSWTLIASGEALSHIVEKGHYLQAESFIRDAHPGASLGQDADRFGIRLSRGHLFVLVEKSAFASANTLNTLGDRQTIQARLMDWVTHLDKSQAQISIWYEDPAIVVYHIAQEVER